MGKIFKYAGLSVCVVLLSFIWYKKRPVKVFLVGDSTVADYTLDSNYQHKKYPITGWGQVFQPLLTKANLLALKPLLHADTVLVDDRAKGGRSTRTFFQEGRWSVIYDELQKGDLVIIQFGHNDAAKDKPERYVGIQGYKEYLRLFVRQCRDKGAVPVLVTPVVRNYPWKDEILGSAHGEYPQAMKDVAREQNVKLIDLTSLSAEAFSRKGRAYVTEHYFMNFPGGKYEAYPNGQHDNTHFQPEGAQAVARLVFEGLADISKSVK